jgi:hypothetical protein
MKVAMAAGIRLRMLGTHILIPTCRTAMVCPLLLQKYFVGRHRSVRSKKIIDNAA